MRQYYNPLSSKSSNIKNERPLKSFIFNVVAFLLIFSLFTAIGWGANQASKPITNLQEFPVTLGFYNLFFYSLKTCIRMFWALIASLIFSLIYAKIASINEYLEQLLIPILDVLQSVPILGFISFTVTIFLNLFPERMIGAELACTFAIFTSQAWNMTYSFYGSLKNLPKDLKDVAEITKMSGWQKFWKLEVPYGIPNLVYNVAVSISGGWFFVVASEVISVGNVQINLPGIGSYIALAIEEGNRVAIFTAIGTIIFIIFSYDKLLLQPLLIWSEKFQYDADPNALKQESFVYNIFQKNLIVNKIFKPLNFAAKLFLYAPILNLKPGEAKTAKAAVQNKKSYKGLFNFFIYAIIILTCTYIYSYLSQGINILDIIEAFTLCSITLIRICVMTALVSILWVPVGVFIGLRPHLAQSVQPLVQFLAAFPVNLIFPASAILINYYNLTPNIWLSPLIIIGSQWYILFNVISGTLAFPHDLTEVVRNLNIKGLLWWRKIIIPAVLPYFLTGLITTFGGAWNASIVAEVINFHKQNITAYGIGSYISQKTSAGDFHHISLGIIMMSLFVLLINRLIWRPLYNLSIKKNRVN